MEKRYRVEESDYEGGWKKIKDYEFEETALRCFREMCLEWYRVRIIDLKTKKIIAY